MDVLSIIIGVVIGAGAGIALTIAFLKKGIDAKSKQIIEEAKAEAEVQRKEKLLQAKEKFLQLKEEHEKNHQRS